MTKSCWACKNCKSATLVTKWSEVMLVLDDWDTEAKIKMLNEIDASFNGMAVELLTELLQ